MVNPTASFRLSVAFLTLGVFALTFPSFSSAWLPAVAPSGPRVPSFSLPSVTRTGSSSRLAASGGFGGGGGKDSKAGKKSSSASSSPTSKETKLKPKQQWDRYVDLKASGKVRVGVRVAGSEESGDGASNWLEVGHVKSASEVSTEVAVARQRALIAEHAKRLFPLQLSAKDRLEWGYFSVEGGAEDGGTWVPVDKSVLDGALPGSEKRMGFEGTPDPATGYYCVYNEGRLVSGGGDKDGGAVLKPSSKRLQ